MIASAHGQAQTETQVQKIPLEGVQLSGNCPNTEVVEVNSGNQVFVIHTTLDANGGFHGKAQINFVDVRGTGQTSGDEYHITSSFSSTSFSSEDGSPTTQTASGTVHITDGINEKGKITVKFTVNADGEVKVDDIKFKTDCS